MYIISPITTYDNDHELWETHIAKDEKNNRLGYSAWGETKNSSRENADDLCELLNKETFC